MADDKLVPVKVKDLKEGDMVDMQKSTLPFPYGDELAEYEYAVVEGLVAEPSGLLTVGFTNMTNVALAPEDELLVARND